MNKTNEEIVERKIKRIIKQYYSSEGAEHDHNRKYMLEKICTNLPTIGLIDEGEVERIILDNVLVKDAAKAITAKFGKPSLKLPERKSITGFGSYDAERIRGFNECRDQVIELNKEGK